MQRVIFDYSARKVDVAGATSFAAQYSSLFVKQQIIDNALESSVGDITLPAIVPLLSSFTAVNVNYLQLISTTPFFIRTTIGGVQSAFQKTSLFSYHNVITPLDGIELYSGTSVYDGAVTFSIDGGTVSQVVTYIQLKF